ncbi:MAG: menaquinone biosynthesis prenyltransferase MqnP [Campylobacterales bacterium]
MAVKVARVLEAIKFEHTIFSLPFIYLAMVVGANGWFGWRLFILATIAAVSARTFAMAANRYLDRFIDAKNPRTANRPTVTGEVTEGDLLVMMLGGALAFIGSSYLINQLAFKLSFLFLIILWSYSYFKRFSVLSHLMLGVSLALAPIAGVVAVQEAIPEWSIFLAAGVMFWVSGFDIIYSIQDIEFDRREGLFSIPAKTGEEGALAVAQMCHGLAILFWALFVAYAGIGFWGWVAVIAGAIVLYQEHQLVKENLVNIPKAFFEMNGWLAILFFLLISWHYI